MRLIIAIAVLFAFASPSWAVQDYDRPYMYCPIGTKWYGYMVLGDIRHCGGPAKAKNGNRKAK